MDVARGRYRELIGRPKQGSKDPVFVECECDETPSGMRLQALVKPSGDVEPQVREYLGNRLARGFGLFTPSPLVVRFEREDLDSFRHHYTRERRFLPQMPPELAGSVKVRLGTNVPLTTSLGPDLYPSAWRLFAFDMMTHYADRTEANPNCSWSSEGLMVFDFEQCFPPDPRLMDAGPIWTPCGRGLARVHFLYRHLSGRTADFSFLEKALEAVSGTEWRKLVEALPESWHEEAHRILDHVATVADHAAEFGEDLRAGLR